MKKQLKFAMKLMISLAFITWIVFVVDWKEVWLHLQKIKPWQIGIYFIVYITGILISAKKWAWLAKIKTIHFPFPHFFKLYFSATFINNFLPSFIGGDTFKAYQIGKPENKYPQAFSTVVVDRITGLLGAMFLTLLFTAINYSTISQNTTLLMINFLIFLILVSFFLFLKLKETYFFKKFSFLIPKKLRTFTQELSSYENADGIFSKSLSYSLLFSFVGLAATNYILFWSLGADISLLNYLSVIFLISIISSIPVSINNIGIKEWAYITFFGFFSLSSSLVVTVALLSRLLQMLISLLAIPFYLKNKEK